jgi:hypothetical protein
MDSSHLNVWHHFDILWYRVVLHFHIWKHCLSRLRVLKLLPYMPAALRNGIQLHALATPIRSPCENAAKIRNPLRSALSRLQHQRLFSPCIHVEYLPVGI